MEQEKQTKKTLSEFIAEHPTAVFWIRFVLWFVCACGLPFAFIAWRYGIFSSESKMQLSGWGFIGIIIVIVFVITLIRYAYKGLKPGMLKQCITGFVSIVLPLLILFIMIVAIEDTLNLFKQALGCVILCEIIGIPLNPFPAWLEQRRIEQGKDQADTLSDIFWSKFFDKKKDGEE